MKKITALIICVIMLTAAAVSVFAEALILPDEYLGKAGDVNMDGETDNKDIAALFRYVSGVKVEVDKKAADCNGDGAIDNKDVVALFRAVKGDCNGDGMTDNKDVVLLFRYLSGQPVELKYGKDDTEGTEETGEQEEIIVPEVTISYFPADVYADKATANAEGFKKASNSNLSTWFKGTIEYDENYDIIPPAEFEHVSDFVIRIAQSKYLEEIMVIRVSDKDAIEAVKALVDYRWNGQKTNDDLELYEPTVFNARKDTGVVTVVGDFIVYAVTENTEVSVLRARKFVQDNPGCSAAELYKAIVCEEFAG